MMSGFGAEQQEGMESLPAQSGEGSWRACLKREVRGSVLDPSAIQVRRE